MTSDLTKLSPEDMAELGDRDDQIDVIGLVVDQPQGFIVQAPTGWGKSYVVRQICQVLPTNRIAIAVPGKDNVQQMYRRLRMKVRDVGMCGAGQNMVNRVTVSTMESLTKLARYEWDLLLFDEVHRAGSPAVANNVAEIFTNTKCVGFSASPTGRSDGSDLVVEALFGPVLYTVSYQEGVDRGAVVPIKVLMYDIETGSPVNTGNPTVRNRHGVWRNKIRNELIAELANTLPQPDDQILIIVGTAEHALHVRNLLPEFDVIFSNVTNKHVLRKIYAGDFAMVKGLDKTGKMHDNIRDRMQKDFESGKLKKVIATGVWNTGVDFTKLRWLIRGDAMASTIQAIQTPGRLSRTSDGKYVGMLVDFLDSFDPTLEGRSKKRIRQYKKNGWDVQIIKHPSVIRHTFSSLRK